MQVCGLWPYTVGSGAPLQGVPLGPHLRGAGTVCGDPVMRFLAGLTTNPSGFVLGKLGLGKSTLVRHIVNLLAAFGVVPLVLSDLRPDYVDLIDALGGDVLPLGPGIGHINPLDPGPLASELHRLPHAEQRRVAAEQRDRVFNVTRGLCELARRDPLADREETLLSTALRVVEDEITDREPVLGDVVAVIRARHPKVRAEAQDRGEDARYDDNTERLVASLQAVCSPDGPFGELFAKPTTVALQVGVPAVFDLSTLDESNLRLQAGVQLVCWAYGQAVVVANKTLADAGLAQRHIHVLIMDELWRMLKASEAMVDRLDDLMRLNRAKSLGQIMITHTMNDLKLASAEATAKARGFVERSALVYLGGLAEAEMGNLAEVFQMSEEEHQLITDWSVGADDMPLDGEEGQHVPPGRGKFLLKQGKAPGVPFEVELTPTEVRVNDTNKDWAAAARRHFGRGERPPAQSVTAPGPDPEGMA